MTCVRSSKGCAILPDAPPPEGLHDIVININDQFLNQYAQHKTLFDGMTYTLTSDLGEVRTGTISNQKIEENQLKISRSFDLQFN